MKQYYELLEKILTYGEKREDRTGVGTLSIFGGQVEFDLRERFPLVTLKKTKWESSFEEMLFFIEGIGNITKLKEHGVNIWNDWAQENGDVGPIYGVQWRHWKKFVINNPENKPLSKRNPTNSLYHRTALDHENISLTVIEIDQLAELITRIKTRPRDRRLIVTAWNPAYLEEMALPPCHRDFQCYVSNDGHLDLMLNIRSSDTMLGLPFNIAQYALLTHLIARATNLKPRYLKINYGDAHIYLNHIEAAKHICQLTPIECDCKLIINTVNTDIDRYSIDDFNIIGYVSHPFIKLPVAV